MELTVAELTRLIVKALSGEEFSDLWVRGEVSNSSGDKYSHLYFTLKDEDSQVPCVMFNHARKLDFEVEDGMKVFVHGDVRVYEEGGKYQLYAGEIKVDGIGDLYKAYELLKKRLKAEGLFEEEHKREIPRYPRRIGIASSASSAGLQDMLNVLGRRYPCEVVLAHTAVQGDGAAEEIARAIQRLNREAVDVIITGRGGGSIEDLWAFNEEPVARAIFNSQTPVISAVGHETDYCISDHVADLRAPTPSAAAELVAESREETLNKLQTVESRLQRAISSQIREYKEQVGRAEKTLDPDRLLERIHDHREEVQRARRALDREVERQIGTAWNRLESMVRRLDAAGPLGALKRGYSLAMKDDEVVDSVEIVETGDQLGVVVFDGFIDCEVRGTEVDTWNLRGQWKNWKRSSSELRRRN